MSYATDYIGVKPVIDLHTAGLKVAEIYLRSQEDPLLCVAHRSALQRQHGSGYLHGPAHTVSGDHLLHHPAPHHACRTASRDDDLLRGRVPGSQATDRPGGR